MIGEPVVRREDVRFLKGRGRFVDDIDLHDPAHLGVVRSPHPHARIVSTDSAAAKALPGVLGVFTAADIEAINRVFPVGLTRSLRPGEQRILPPEKAIYVGQPVAFVVAEDRYIAEDAVQLVNVEYEPLPGVGNFDTGLKAEVPIHPGVPDNIAGHQVQQVGNVDAVLRSAPHTLHETFDLARGGGHSMECRTTAAEYLPELDSFVVWDSTQSPHGAKRLLAFLYGLPEESFRVIAPDVGGGFGPKGARYPEELVLPWLAKRLGRPVKFVEDRFEHFVACSMEHPQHHEVDVAYDDNGVLLGLRDNYLVDVGAYCGALIVPMIAGCTVPGPYRIPNLHIEFRAMYSNKVPGGAVRGAGRPQGVFVMERIMDRIAEQLGIDRAEVRFRNFIQPDEFPYPVGLIFRDGAPMTYDSGNYPGLLKTGLEILDYPKQLRLQQEARAQGKYRGIGISIAVEGVGFGPFEGATVRMEANGRATVVLSASPQGQGYETTFAQICADYLGVDAEQIDVVSGDTSKIPWGNGSFASRVVSNMGPALAEAAAEVKEKILRSAGAFLEAAPSDLEISKGYVRVKGVPESGMPLAEVARACNVGAHGISMGQGAVAGLMATSYFSPERAGYPCTVQLCTVDVDAESGEVKIVDWVVGHDCGRVINPLLVDGQVLGGLAHGLSNALYEEAVYSPDGVPRTTSYLEYPIPSAREFPWVKLYSQETLSPLNPLGVKGAGEAGTLGVPALIAGAVEDALRPLGVEFRSAPLSPALIADLAAEARAQSRGRQV